MKFEDGKCNSKVKCHCRIIINAIMMFDVIHNSYVLYYIYCNTCSVLRTHVRSH